MAGAGMSVTRLTHEQFMTAVRAASPAAAGTNTDRYYFGRDGLTRKIHLLTYEEYMEWPGYDAYWCDAFSFEGACEQAREWFADSLRRDSMDDLKPLAYRLLNDETS